MLYSLPFIPQKNERLTTLSGGGDNPCTSNYPLTKTFLWALFKDDYETAASEVKARINYNRGNWDYGWYNNCYPVITGLDKNCTDLAQVSCIMNVYYKEGLAGVIPEYDPSNFLESNKTPARLASEAEATIQHVTKISGQAYFRVKEVINHLYWATWENSADRISYQYIAPVRYNLNKGKLEKPENAGSGVQSASDTLTSSFDTLITVGKWILIIGGIGVAAYFLFPVFSAIKSKT